MIKPKEGKCVDCPPGAPEKPLVDDRCQIHYWSYRSAVSREKKRLRYENDPEIARAKEELAGWFKYHISINRWICENCGISIPHYTDDICYSAQAHILPKKTFLSVSSNLDNHMTLGALYSACECHGRFDWSWEKAVTMPVWSLAVQRFQLFKHLLTPSEIGKLPEVFRPYL
jgi:hypothetical protein